jgi:hypothetical protein
MTNCTLSRRRFEAPNHTSAVSTGNMADPEGLSHHHVLTRALALSCSLLWMFNIHRLSYIRYRTSVPKYLPYVRFHGTYRPELLLAPEPGSPAAVKFAQMAARKRGGENLTDRDIGLSKSLRRKQAFSRGGVSETYTEARSPAASDLLAHAAQGHKVASGPSKPSVITFRGLVIPEKPRPPEADGSYTSTIHPGS